ncbi:hypothetical protein [Algoriphagus aquimarinus]|uniref:WG repeat-containing protein n=1 Tax=Algoriphagus aquimarinus TaxID=237018 RepID=A0A1I0XZ57_9BACT|nr:hypothetical protein [Algoriphagus aquimarinus]SFB05957.1 hypothetical protein SAMN04489723_10412 [Algoriphagus aquimarinus]
MKINLIILFSLMTLFSCQAQITDKKKVETPAINSTDFQVNFDTLNISIDGYLRKVVLFQDNFYGMFETGRRNTSQRFKKMIVFSQNGDFVEDVFVPKEIQGMPHYDLIVQNDSLYVKESQFEKINFLLGKYVADFKLTETKDLKFYQDELYDIYATCNGEWGGTIYFKNKKTNESFEASSTCSIVINKIDGEYYVTNYMGHMMGFASILKIQDPSKLEKSNLKFDRHEGSRFDKGVETLLDTIDFYIPTSFVVDKQLYHLYSDENGTYIGLIENGKMKPIHKFDFIFHAHFNQHLDNGKQLLTFNFKESEKSGILIIDGKYFTFYRQK